MEARDLTPSFESRTLTNRKPVIGASNPEYGSRSITSDANLDEKRLHKCHMHHCNR